MALVVIDRETRKPFTQPHLVRVAGWTLERYLQEAPENAFREFVCEGVIMHSPVRAKHHRVVRFLTFLLQGYCTKRALGCEVFNGPARVRLASNVIRESDIFVLDAEEVKKAQGFPVEARPLLVVEVVTPATRTLDLVEKPQDYARAGVPEYWNTGWWTGKRRKVITDRQLPTTDS